MADFQDYSPAVLPRLASTHLAAAAAVMPVAVVMGARQTGKSTLVRTNPVFGQYPYLTLDRSDVRAQAIEAPATLLERGPKLVIDEVQRAPDLLLALKAHIDAQPQRVAGQFLLTGSANMLSMRQVSESLAGRASYTTLWPMTRRERLGFGDAGLWSSLAANPFGSWFDIVAASESPADDWRTLAPLSGYPTPALDVTTDDARAIWFQSYVDTYLDRDLRDLAAISNQADFRRLMRIATLRVGSVINRAEWARDAALPASTVARYLDLLDTSYQLVRIEAFATNRTKRLIKSPKAYWSDTSLAMFIAGERDARGAHLENLVVTDLLAWRDSQPRRPAILHWRTTTGEEVDFVLELPDGSLVGIECKGGASPSFADTKGLRAFIGEYGDRVLGTLILHGGTDTYQLAPRVLATPWWRVF